MNTMVLKKKSVRSEGEKLLPSGINIESLKRIHALRASLTDVGFSWLSEFEAERVVVHGDVQVSY